MTPVELDGSVRSRAMVRWRLDERRARTDLGLFIERTTPWYVAPRHLQPVLDLWDDIERGEEVFALVEAPPRHGKSEIVFHGAARHLRWNPTHIVTYATYSGDFARDQSKIARATAARAGIFVGQEQTLEDAFDPSASARFWQVAGGGGFLAVGRKGNVTGKGVNVLVIDDPFKDRAEAESAARRREVWDWYTGTLRNRLEPGGSAIITHQRWNDDDLIARIAAQAAKRGDKRWRRITLPAINTQGQPLWPQRFGLDALGTIRADIEEYNWWSQYMQRPRPQGSLLFRDPARYPVPLNLKGARLAIAVDPAATEKTSADHSAIGIGAYWGWSDEMRLYVRRVWQVQLEVPDLVDFLLALEFRLERLGFPLTPIVIESVGAFKSVPQTLRRLNRDLTIIETHPDTSKFVRSQMPAAAWNRGRIIVPEQGASADPAFAALEQEVNAHPEAPWLDRDRARVNLAKADLPWLDGYLDEVCRFTGVGDPADDQVDMTVHLWDHGERAFEGESGGSSDATGRAMADTGGF